MTHRPYQDQLGHPADFKVHYRFFEESEGGRKILPCQGYRSDFWYYTPDNTFPHQVYMIWPEFLDNSGLVIIDKAIEIPRQGNALMWVIDPKRRSFHYKYIIKGLKGFFMEGQRKVAGCEVIEVIGLKTNPG
jgi:hypothetical protein